VRVCAIFYAPGSVRLLAIVRDADPGAVAAPQVVASEIVTVKSKLNVDIPAWLTTVLTTIAGFVFGLALQRVQQSEQRKEREAEAKRHVMEEADKHRRDTEKTLTDSLAAEISANLATLDAIVAGGPPHVLKADTAALFSAGDGDVFAYLGLEARPALDNIAALYKAIGLYNDVRTLWEQAQSAGLSGDRIAKLDKAAREGARVLRDLLKNRVAGAPAAYQKMVSLHNSVL
jgi:hypothetical protein